MTTAAAWILSLMLSVAPPRDSSNAKWSYIDARETKEDAVARYEEIAQAAADVAFDENEPALFGGSHGRARTAALLISVAFNESGFRRDVDLGIGPKARGSGIDSCLMQVRGLHSSLTAEGWTWRELVSDRQKCFRAGLHVIRKSITACSKYPQLDQLAVYTSGKCGSGLLGSRMRVGLALRMYAARPAPEKDASWLIAKVEPVLPVLVEKACYAACGRLVGGQSAGE
jgi:hypothetical protein